MANELTEEAFFAAINSVRRHVAPTPDVILVSQATVDAARWAAHMLEVAAACAWEELIVTPRWRWLRRRAINRQISDRVANAESLRGTFGWPR